MRNLACKMKKEYLKALDRIDTDTIDRIFIQIKLGTQCCDIIDFHIEEPPLVLTKSVNGLVCDIFQHYSKQSTKLLATRLVCVLFGYKLSTEQVKSTTARLINLSERHRFAKIKDLPFTFPVWKTVKPSGNESVQPHLAEPLDPYQQQHTVEPATVEHTTAHGLDPAECHARDYTWTNDHHHSELSSKYKSTGDRTDMDAPQTLLPPIPMPEPVLEEAESLSDTPIDDASLSTISASSSSINTRNSDPDAIIFALRDELAISKCKTTEVRKQMASLRRSLRERKENDMDRNIQHRIDNIEKLSAKLTSSKNRADPHMKKKGGKTTQLKLQTLLEGYAVKDEMIAEDLKIEFGEMQAAASGPLQREVMMVNDKTSVAMYLDTFDLSDDFNSYTCGHVLKTYEASNKKIEQTVMAIQSRFVHINYNETHNWVDGIIRKYTTVLKTINKLSGSVNFRILCATKFEVMNIPTPCAQKNPTEMLSIMCKAEATKAAINMRIADVDRDVEHALITLAQTLDITVAKLLRVLLELYHNQHGTEMYSTPSAPTEASTTCSGSEQSQLIKVDADLTDASVRMNLPLKRSADSEIDLANSSKRLKNEAEVNQPSQLKQNEIGLLNSMVNIKPDPDYDQDDADCALSNDNALCDSNNGVTLGTDDIKVKLEDLDLKSETTTSQECESLHVCVICDDVMLPGGAELMTLSADGADIINEVSRNQKLDDAKTIPGQQIHANCWTEHTKPKELLPQTTATVPSVGAVLHPDLHPDLHPNLDPDRSCVLCGKVITTRESCQSNLNVSASTMKEMCDGRINDAKLQHRTDEWAEEVRERLTGSRYKDNVDIHQDCVINFRTNKHKPMSCDQGHPTMTSTGGEPQDGQCEVSREEMGTHQ